MKIGIGIITNDRNGVVKQTYDQHIKFKHKDSEIVIFDNDHGVEQTVIKVLKYFKDYDFVVVSNDNIVPKKHWLDQFLEAYRENPDQHLFFNIPNQQGVVKDQVTDHCVVTEKHVGAFIFMTNFALCGLIDKKLDLENKTYLTPIGLNATIRNAEDYLGVLNQYTK